MPPCPAVSRPPTAAVPRRDVLATGFAAFAASRPAAAAPPASIAPPKPVPGGPELTVVDASVVAALRRRDEAAGFKCKGGMMDCDGDRREFAKKQYQIFLEKKK